MSYLKLAEKALEKIDALNKESHWEPSRFRLLKKSFDTLGNEFKRLFPQGAKGVIQWIKTNCPKLASKITSLEEQIELECLSELVSLDQYKDHLTLWIQAYLEGFRRYESTYSSSTTQEREVVS